MTFSINVNNRKIQARKGETILNALVRHGIHVPTLCNMKDFSPTGACRMCVVEVDGEENLLPSCSFTVEEDMSIRTHSPRVLRARKTIVELLLSNHPDDCLYCERNRNCELQKLAEDLNVRERRIPGRKSRFKIDKSGMSIVREPSKCILCGRCVRVCEEIQQVATLDFTYRGSRLTISPALNKPLNFSNCISCGQCVIVCPTAALTEKVQFQELDQSLHDPSKKVIVQFSPVVSVSIAEEFGLKPGKDINGLMIAALRKIGFDKVFDTSFGADVQFIELAEEFLHRLDSGDKLPLITGCCPSWIIYAEQNAPEYLPNIASVKSPQQITGALIRTYVSEKYDILPADIYSVSVMPCTSKKNEAQRAEMTSKGISDIDTVLTTRELARLIRLNGIDLLSLEPEIADEPMGSMSSTGKLVGVSGGTLESLIRAIYYRHKGQDIVLNKLVKLRQGKMKREICFSLGKREIEAVAVSGIANAAMVLDDVKNGRKNYQIIEIMACPGGCINGGGQPIGGDDGLLKSRAKSLYDYDSRDIIKMPYKNPQVVNIYDEFLLEPSGKISNELFSVKYSKPKDE